MPFSADVAWRIRSSPSWLNAPSRFPELKAASSPTFRGQHPSGSISSWNISTGATHRRAYPYRVASAGPPSALGLQDNPEVSWHDQP